jgi:hypothetical protein
MAARIAPKKPSVGPITLHLQGFSADPHCQQIGKTKKPMFSSVKVSEVSEENKKKPGTKFQQTAADKMDFPICIPICFQCGNTDNPCRCKVVGPTLGFVLAALSAILFYPAGLVTYACDRKQSQALFAAPAQIQWKMSSGIPF